MFRLHLVWQLLALPADEFGCSFIQWSHGRSHGCCCIGHFVNFGWESCTFLWEVTVAIVAKMKILNNNHCNVSCKWQKISLKKAQYYSLYNSIDDNKFTPWSWNKFQHIMHGTNSNVLCTICCKNRITE